MTVVAGLVLGIALAADNAGAHKVSFRNDVEPILQRHCRGCHSSARAKGKLNMDSVAQMRKGGHSGPLFVPGKPDESRLIEVVSGPEPSMPQKQPPLSAEKIQILRQWVLAGGLDDTPPGADSTTTAVPQTYPFAPAVTAVAFDPDGKRLAAACSGEVVLVDVGGKIPPRRLATTSDWLSHIEFAPGGKILAAAGGSPGRYGEVTFFDPTTCKALTARRVGKDTLFRGNFSPDGKAIALGGPDGAIHVVPFDPSQPVRRFELHSDWVMDVAYTPDGKLLVSVGRDKATKIASAQTGELLRVLDSSPERMTAVAADSLFALSAGKARTLLAYDLKVALEGIPLTGAGLDSRPLTQRVQYARDFEPQLGEVLTLATSGDRKVVAAAGSFNEVRVYQVATRQRVALVANVPAPVYAIALNANGSRLALGSKTGLVQIYELPTGKLLQALVPVPVAAPLRAQQ
jgi:hypothetical protein